MFSLKFIIRARLLQMFAFLFYAEPSGMARSR